jgi:S-adenosylmethionine uptake transporter
MSVQVQDAPLARPGLGIIFITVGMAAISVNDMLIKHLSGGYPLHEMVFVRSLIGIFFSLVLVQFEGGFSILKTSRPVLHTLRGLAIVFSNLAYFTALAVVPLGEATALFFVAPLMITLLSIPLLGEKVGPFRIGAVAVGFLGVIVMIRPWNNAAEREASLWILLLPVLGAFTYALFQIMTRKLGVGTRASAMAVYTQAVFIVVAALFFLVAGDGRFAQGSENASVLFILRAWQWPQGTDIYLFLGLGLNSAIVAYALSQAYRLAAAATIAPFEYVGLPLAVMWGWLFWAEVPDTIATLGIVLIAGSGLFVFLRERQRNRLVASSTRIRRRF